MKPYIPVALLLLSTTVASAVPAAAPDGPRYDAAGKLLAPPGYRTWVFLSSGIDTNYDVGAKATGAHIFGNVFAPRLAYDAFQRTGHWPDKTVLILENRGGTGNASINQRGLTQTGEVIGVEAHVRDEKRFEGGWGFFVFDGGKPAGRIAYTADCYACHRANAAVDTSFVQFYPTLLPVATARKTLSPAYLAAVRAGERPPAHPATGSADRDARGAAARNR